LGKNVADAFGATATAVAEDAEAAASEQEKATKGEKKEY
jgi:hypothetical protein